MHATFQLLKTKLLLAEMHVTRIDVHSLVSSLPLVRVFNSC